MYGHVVVVLFAVTVLGIDAYLASIFLPNLHRDFTIFALVVTSLTILTFLVLNQWSQPITEFVCMFVLAVLWLGMGAWSADIIGNVQCDAIESSSRTQTKSGSVSSKAYCYEMKVIEAFSWMNFVLLAVFIWILIALTSRAKVFGRYRAWFEPVWELPWFGQYPGGMEQIDGSPGRYNYAYPAGSPMGYPGGMPMQQPFPQQPFSQQPQLVNGGYLVSQQPGHSVVIQPNAHGAPMVTQVPGMVTSV